MIAYTNRPDNADFRRTESMAGTKKPTAKKAAAKPSKKVAAKPAKRAETPKITADMTLGEAVSKYPQTMEVLFRHGLHCIGCHVSAYETIAQGAMAHGLDEKEVKKMVEEMNKKI
jgi:hybrid cluster-associated redox disulfide protein